jgi:hypothetical protein
MRSVGLLDASALLVDGTRETVGVPYERLLALARDADVLLNLSGSLVDQALLESMPVRVYVDLDPGFTQVWAEQGIRDRFAGHTDFVTVGTAIGRPGCPVPTCGRSWSATLPPVALSEWSAGQAIRFDAFTSVGTWRGYGPVEHAGLRYGQRAHSFRTFLDLPARTGEAFMLAFDLDPGEVGDLPALAANGWRLLNPSAVARSPATYRSFVRGSRAEFGVAKSGYVVSRCGWFSDRSAAYLASGRPVLAQDTGFADVLPTGEGLFSFSSVDDVTAAIDELRADYDRHSKAARAIAEDILDSDVVLQRLLDGVGAT